MKTHAIKTVALLLIAASACMPDARAGDAVAQIRPMGPPCGLSTQDWCAAPAGDVCGEHADEAACRADAHCEGMPYRGESAEACMADGKGFWKNCPAVGCVSRNASARAR